MQEFRKLSLCSSLTLLTLLPVAAGAVSSGGSPRNHDARLEARPAAEAAPGAEQLAAFAALQQARPGTAVSWDTTTGAARTLVHRLGHLTPAAVEPPRSEADALALGLAYVRSQLPLLGLEPADLERMEVTDAVFSRVSGAWHFYLRQTHAGLPVYNAQLHVNVNREGRILSVNNSFLPHLAAAVNGSEPVLDAAQAVRAALVHLDRDPGAEPRVTSTGKGSERRTTIEAAGISREPVEARLLWLPVAAGEARLVWNFQIATLDSQNWFDFNVDASDGRVWTRFDWVDDAGYTVYPRPVESPNHTTPLPPADGRTLATDPQDPTASPFGWHDTDGMAGAEFTIHRGNNVHAYDDRNSDDAPPATQPDCGPSLDCTFPIDLTMAPSAYTSAAVTELFYWNNIIHDVHYHYGFDEMGGNFQVNNYGNGGAAGDDVRAEAQDGSGTNNANFGTPPDGQRPRMQMFEFTITTPRRDGDFDHGIVVHEYGHGITNRIVGGPANASCLNNTQQPGEGWSDWFALVYTATAAQTGPDIRGSGTYVLGQPTNGPGVRPQPYTTDPVANTYTYESISGLSIPHGLGSVWAQAAWEVYWALVDLHGFDADLYDAMGGAGNQRALLYVTEGLKNIPCEPTFIDVRDGILQAAADFFGGEDVCPLWEAFAAFGLGEDASTPGPGSSTATNGFTVPIECVAEFTMAIPDTHESVCAPDDATYSIDIGNNGSAEAVTLAVTGVPAGAGSGFSVNPVTPVGSSTLTISNTGSAATGSTMMEVTGTNSTGTIGIDLTLDISDAVPGTATLTTPADDEVGTPTAPTFTWTAASQGLSYLLEVAEDAGFSSVVYMATVTGTSHQAAVNLDPDTEYFWRLTASNDCGTGAASAVFSFTTANQLCFQPGLAVPDNTPAGVTDTQTILTGGEITDLNVQIGMTHTFLGDLRFTLTHVDTGTSVVVFNRPSSCNGNDMEAEFDDEATTPIGCMNANIPAVQGLFIPANPLSAFDGEDLSGSWAMNVSDNANIDVGTLDEWCLVTAIIPATPPLFTDGFESGDTSAWSLVVP